MDRHSVDFEVAPVLYRISSPLECGTGKLAGLGIEPCNPLCLSDHLGLREQLVRQAFAGVVRVAIKHVEVPVRLQQCIGYRLVLNVACDKDHGALCMARKETVWSGMPARPSVDLCGTIAVRPD